MNVNRRNFIKEMAATTTFALFPGTVSLMNFHEQTKRYPIFFFTKPLDIYGAEFIAETLAQAGADGFDLSVRPRGLVEPERIRDELPKVIELGKKYNLRAEMMVSAITTLDDVNSRRVLETAAKEGIKHYRIGYYDYDFNKGIIESLNAIKVKLTQLALLNKEVGIQGGYQNHSGIKVGAPMWDVWELIKDIPSGQISSQFDIRHAVTEAAASWILALRLLHKNIGSLAIKDFTWAITGNKAKVVSVPLGEGIVDFDLFFSTLKEMNLVAPISMHIEYPFLNKEEENQTLLQKQKIIVSKLKKDVDFIRANLIKYKLI